MEDRNFIFMHRTITDKEGRPMYLNLNKKTKEITTKRNLINNDTYLVKFTLGELLYVSTRINVDEWEMLLEKELGSKNLFNLKHEYLKEDGKDVYLNLDKKNNFITVNKGCVNNSVYQAEFRKDEIETLKKKYNLDGFKEVGVK